MAVTSGTVNTGTYSKSHFYVKWQQVSQSIPNNTTTINWECGINTGTTSSHDYWYSNAVKVYDIVINGTTVSSGGTWSNITTGGDHQLLTGTFTIPHNQDGSKTFSISFSAWLYSNHNLSGSGSFQLNSIPRYTTITSFNVSKRSETSVTVTWNASDNCDAVWYSTNNGGSWTQSSGTTFIIENLRPNTTYKFKIRVRRRDSQLTTDSNTVSQTTFKVPTQTLKSKTETSISITWSSDSTANYIWYSKDNGANWIAVGAVNATSGSYTINGLIANTNYNIKTRVRRSLANTTYDTSTLAVPTYNYPYVSEIGTDPLIIGKSQTLKLYNPLGRSVNVYMKQDSTTGTQLYSIGSSSTSVTFTPNLNTLLSSIPNSTTGNAIYYCEYSNKIVSTKSGTYLIDNTDNSYNPDFNLEDWTYTANLTELTNDNQIVIANQSTITVTINNVATAKGGATISGYNIVWGTKKETTSEIIGSVEKGDSDALIVQAIDSRGYTTTTTLQLEDKYINYYNPTLSSGEALRDDGISTDTFLSLRGGMYASTFGVNGVQNVIESAKYYTSTDNENWSEAFDIDATSFTYSSNNYILNNYSIHNDGTSGGFPVGNRYYVKVDITDKLSTSTFVGIQITDGELAIDRFQDDNHKYHTGINGLADISWGVKAYGGLLAEDSLSISNSSGGSLLFGQPPTENDVDCTFPTHSGLVETRTILYDNVNGSNGTITLSENAENFDYLKIHFMISSEIISGYEEFYSGFISEIKLSSINKIGIYGTLSGIIYDTGTFIAAFKAINISKKQITNITTMYRNITNDSQNTDNLIYITYVEGIKIS